MEGEVESVSKDNEENVELKKNTEVKASTPPEEVMQKKSKKEDRRKDDKNLESLMKSLNSIPSVEERLSHVCKKYVQATDENKKLQFYVKQSDKRYTLLLKEKEHLQLEFNKTVLVKSKLESLCRELQKQNKAIKEESLLRIREEEERRKETQGKFQTTLAEITTLLQQNNEKNAKLRDDNVSMGEKFKGILQQYQLREQQVDKMTKQMELESQLSDAKLQKANLEHQAEKERLLVEMEHMKMEVAQCRAKIMELQGTETGLRSQISVYTDKYDEFQSALMKSNQVFGGFKGEMEKMSKKIQKLEKESLSWKKRWEQTQAALIESCSDKQSAEQRSVHTAKQLEHMQRLCRTLQGERTALLSTLKEHNIERPPLPPPAPAPAPAPPPPPAEDHKVEAMAANCAQLRQSLAQLQNQLNVITTQKQAEEQPKQESKPKKSKTKKNKDKSKQIDRSENNENVENTSPEAEKSVETSKEDETKEIIEEKTMGNLIEAINQANISLGDLEAGNTIENANAEEKKEAAVINSTENETSASVASS